MSYILEALKKSDRQRQTPRPAEQSATTLASPSDQVTTTGRWQIILLLCSLISLVCWQQWSVISSLLAPTSTQQNSQTAPEPLEARPVVVNPTHHSQTSLSQQQAAIRQQMHTYSQEKASPEHEIAPPPPRPTAVPETVATEAEPQITQAHPAQSTSPAASTLHQHTAPIPSMRELTALQQQQIPELNVSVSIYSKRAKNRRTRINNVMYYEGDTLSPRLTLVEIRPNALILNHNGQLFRISP